MKTLLIVVSFLFHYALGARVTDNLMAMWTFEEGQGTTSALHPSSPVDVGGLELNEDYVQWIYADTGKSGIRVGTNPSSADTWAVRVDNVWVIDSDAEKALDKAKEITMEVWFEPENSATEETLLHLGGATTCCTAYNCGALDMLSLSAGNGVASMDLARRVDTTLITNMQCDHAPASTTFSNNNLYHLVALGNFSTGHNGDAEGEIGASKLIYYVNNGELVTSDIVGDFHWWDSAYTTAFHIGGDGLDKLNMYQGIIRQVALYTRALDESEIDSNYAAGVTNENQAANLVITIKDDRNEGSVCITALPWIGSLSVGGSGITSVPHCTSASTSITFVYTPRESHYGKDEIKLSVGDGVYTTPYTVNVTITEDGGGSGATTGGGNEAGGTTQTEVADSLVTDLVNSKDPDKTFGAGAGIGAGGLLVVGILIGGAVYFVRRRRKG